MGWKVAGPSLRCLADRTRSPKLASAERFQRPPLRYRRLGGGYRKEDVEFALAELRLTLRQLDIACESSLSLLR